MCHRLRYIYIQQCRDLGFSSSKTLQLIIGYLYEITLTLAVSVSMQEGSNSNVSIGVSNPYAFTFDEFLLHLLLFVVFSREFTVVFPGQFPLISDVLADS